MKMRVIGWLLSAVLILQSFGVTPVLANEIDSADSNYKAEIRGEVSRRTTVNNVEFELMTEGTAILVDGSLATGKYTIPKSVTYGGKIYTVTEIAGNAFCNNTALKEVVMPSTITKIADGEYDDATWEYKGAFSGCTALETVTFSTNLEYIGVRAFSKCASLENVILPNKVEAINEEAFSFCPKITSLELPESVTTVGQCAFTATSIKEFTIPKTATMFNDWALDDIETLECITVEEGHPSYASKDGVWYTAGYGWLIIYPANKKGDTYQMPENTTVIRSAAFSGCKYLKTIVLNSKVNTESLGTAMLSRSSVKAIKVSKDNPNLKAVDGVLYTKNGETLLLYPPQKTDKIFFVPSGVKEIGGPGCYSFERCNYLEELYIPASVKSWEGIAWMSESLKKVVYASESQIEMIACSIFQECTALESICLPKNVKYLDASNGFGNQFMDCYTIKSLYVPKDAPFYASAEWGCQSLSGCTDTLTVYGHGSNNKLSLLAEEFYCGYVDVSGGFDKVLGVTFADTVMSLKKGESKNVEAVVYPENTTSKSLTYVSSNTAIATISNDGTVTAVSEGECYITATATDDSGEYARCKIIVASDKEKPVSIKDAKVTLSTTSYTYNGKAKKPSVTIKLDSKKLVKDKDYTVTYKDNKNIGTATVIIKGKGNYTGTLTKTFTINAKKGATFTSGSYKYKVTSASAVAFAGFAKKEAAKVTIPKTVKYGGKTFKVTTIESKALKGKTKVTQVTIGANVTSIGSSAFEGCKKLSKVTLGSAVTTIGVKAFKGCTALKSITIPSKVTKIDKQAFYGCKNLKTITIKATKLKTVGKESLKGIKSNATIKVPKSKLTVYKKLLKKGGLGSKVKVVKY